MKMALSHKVESLPHERCISENIAESTLESGIGRPSQALFVLDRITCGRYNMVLFVPVLRPKALSIRLPLRSILCGAEPQQFAGLAAGGKHLNEALAPLEFFWAGRSRKNKKQMVFAILRTVLETQLASNDGLQCPMCAAPSTMARWDVHGKQKVNPA
jgi:hypothetical protein